MRFIYLFISVIWIQIPLNKKDIAVSYYALRGVDFPNSTKLPKVVRQEILTPSCASAIPNLCWQTSPILLLCEIFYSIDSWNQFLLSNLKFCWPLVEIRGLVWSGRRLFVFKSFYYLLYFCFPFEGRCQIPQTPNCTHKYNITIPGRRLNCTLQGWVQLKTLSLKRIGLSAE